MLRNFLSRLILIQLFLLSYTAVCAEKTALQIQKDISYRNKAKVSRYEAERCKLDLYLPVGRKNFPTLVWFHGGGLTEGDKAEIKTANLAKHYAEAGLAIASVNYRLSPKAKYPAYIQDAAAAFAWVKKHITEYGGAADQVFIGGHSAGAYLALMVGMDSQYIRLHGLKAEDIAGLVSVAGQTLTHYTIRLERGLPKNRIIADAGAPLHHVRKDAPPMLILYADKDMPLRREENELLAAALRHAGHTQATVRMIKNRDHGSVAHLMAKPRDTGFSQVMKFIASQQH